MIETTSLARSVKQPTAFNEFYETHANGLLRFFARRTLDPEAAADLTAETFAQAYQSRRRFRGQTDREAAGWLYVIAHRQLARYRRRGMLERRAVERLGLEVAAVEEGEYERIEELAGLSALRHELAEGLARLSPDTRAALQLRVVEELPYSRIAERLQVTEQAARARVSRALRGLGDYTNQEMLT